MTTTAVRMVAGLVVLAGSGCGETQEPSAKPPAPASPPAIPAYVTRKSEQVPKYLTTPISDATFNKVAEIVSKMTDRPIEEITLKTSLGELDFDELDVIDLTMKIEDAFSTTIPDDLIGEITPAPEWGDVIGHAQYMTIQQICAIVDIRMGTTPQEEAESKPAEESSPKKDSSD